MSEKAGIICVSPLSSLIVIVPKKAQPGELSQKCLCVDNYDLNSLLSPVVTAHSEAQGVLSLVSLPKCDELYALLNGSIVYSSLDCTSGYHHISLSPKAQKQSTFVTPCGNLEFKKVPFCLVQAPTDFQQLINNPHRL